MTDTDWSAVIGAIATGVVGVAGIAGSILSARLAGKSAARDLQTSIGAENERVRLAEKRRSYASCLTTLNLYLSAKIKTELYQNQPYDSERAKAATDSHTAFIAATNAVYEIKLMGGAEVSNLAADVLGHLADFKADGGWRSTPRARSR